MTDRQYDAALRELDIARVGLPNSAELLHVVASIEQRRGRWAESLAAYMRAFELDPASTAELIALHYMHQREYAEVRRYISVAKPPTARRSWCLKRGCISVSAATSLPRDVYSKPRAAPDRPPTAASSDCSLASSGSMAIMNAHSN